MRQRLLIAFSCVLAATATGIAAPSKPGESLVVRKLVLRNLLPSEAAKSMGGIKATKDSKTKKVAVPKDALTMDAKNKTHTLVLRGPKEEVDKAEEIIMQLDAMTTQPISMRFLVRLLRVPALDNGTASETTLAAETVNVVNLKEVMLSLPYDVNTQTPNQETQPNLRALSVSTRYDVVIMPHLMPATKRVSLGVSSSYIGTTVLQSLKVGTDGKQSLPSNRLEEATYKYTGSTTIGTAIRSTLYLEPESANNTERFKHILEITPLPGTK